MRTRCQGRQWPAASALCPSQKEPLSLSSQQPPPPFLPCSEDSWPVGKLGLEERAASLTLCVCASVFVSGSGSGSGGDQKSNVVELPCLGNEGRSGKQARELGSSAAGGRCPLAHLGPFLQPTKTTSAWLAGRTGANLGACLPVTARLLCCADAALPCVCCSG